MAISKFKRQGKKGVLTFEGELTLEHAEKVRSALIKALIEADAVEIAFNSVGSMDLTFLQLLCSAHRSAVRFNKRLAFADGRPEALIRIMQGAGFARTTGCGLDCEKSCLWRLGAVREGGA